MGSRTLPGEKQWEGGKEGGGRAPDWESGGRVEEALCRRLPSSPPSHKLLSSQSLRRQMRLSSLSQEVTVNGQMEMILCKDPALYGWAVWEEAEALGCLLAERSVKLQRLPHQEKQRFVKGSP